jgi:hypothetical protein
VAICCPASRSGPLCRAGRRARHHRGRLVEVDGDKFFGELAGRDRIFPTLPTAVAAYEKWRSLK